MSNIKAVILDKDGVFVNFQKLWLRVIACRAQIIAERTTESWDIFNKVRTACIRAMGVDEDDESIDPYSPVSMPAHLVDVALYTALYLTLNEINPKFSWKESRKFVDDSIEEANRSFDIMENSDPIEGSIEKIKEIDELGFELAVYTSDTQENAEKTLEKFGIRDYFNEIFSGKHKDQKTYEQLCKNLGLDPSETVLVSDSPKELISAKQAGAETIALLSGVSEKRIFESKGVSEFIDQILPSLKDLDLKNLSAKKKVEKV
jgi:HAD superfamily hydrolase (TIGR01549 family)